ncbi:MAG: hypothetical protein EOP10_32480 [Proteobacteria bacterium]|nr:MAG: hypothetical protein EOP10_32480 [Pseudomonadota bacterium]
MDAEKNNYPIKRLCGILGVSESGYHAWLKRPESPCARDDRLLAIRIKSEFERSCKTYGSSRIKQDLDAQGIRAGKHRVARLMKETGIRASAPSVLRARLCRSINSVGRRT